MISIPKNRKTLLWVGLGLSPFVLVFGLLLVFPLANFGAGIVSILIEREPTQAELIGDYKYDAEWGAATLHLNSDGSFDETITEKSGDLRRTEGSWTSTKR